MEATVDPTALALDCPTCGNAIYSQRAGQWVAETRIVKFVGGRVLLKCTKCRSDVPVPWLSIVASPPPARADRASRGVRTVVHVAQSPRS